MNDLGALFDDSLHTEPSTNPLLNDVYNNSINENEEKIRRSFLNNNSNNIPNSFRKHSIDLLNPKVNFINDNSIFLYNYPQRNSLKSEENDLELYFQNSFFRERKDTLVRNNEEEIDAKLYILDNDSSQKIRSKSVSLNAKGEDCITGLMNFEK